MTKEDQTQVTPSGNIPNDPTADHGKGIPFSLSIEGEGSSGSFNPVYYPDRYNDTLDKELSRDARQCGGEDVSIDETKNPEFHATGIVLDGNVSNFRRIRKHKGPVNLITPLTDNAGGMEVIVKKGKIGEIVGWDAIYQQWQFKYTLDLVATGGDTDESGNNGIVSAIIAENEELQNATSGPGATLTQ